MTDKPKIEKLDIPDIMTTDDLDYFLDEGATFEQLEGKKVEWHGGQKFPITRLKDGQITLRARLRCSKCHKHSTTAYLGSGLHSGAWCYAYDIHGEFMANLRDQIFICRYCSEQTHKYIHPQRFRNILKKAGFEQSKYIPGRVGRGNAGWFDDGFTVSFNYYEVWIDYTIKPEVNDLIGNAEEQEEFCRKYQEALRREGIETELMEPKIGGGLWCYLRYPIQPGEPDHFFKFL